MLASAICDPTQDRIVIDLSAVAKVFNSQTLKTPVGQTALQLFFLKLLQMSWPRPGAPYISSRLTQATLLDYGHQL